MTDNLSSLSQSSKHKDSINVLTTYNSASREYTCTYYIPRAMSADIKAGFRGCWPPGSEILGVPRKTPWDDGFTDAMWKYYGQVCSESWGSGCNYVRAQICNK
jgi:hypothetical protein